MKALNRWFPLPLHQFLNQLVFLYAGKELYRLSVTWVEIGLILFSAVLLEHLLILVRERRISAFSFAAVSSAFNVAFMLGATNIWAYVLALGAGLGQKHLAKRFAGRHFLNPSNFGIVVALLALPQFTYVTFLDWGQTPEFAVAIAALGGFILLRVGLLVVPIVFLASHAALQLLLHQHDANALLLQVQTAGFLLFAFFMITDPRTLPHSRGFLVLHTLVTAFLVNLLPLLFGPKDVNLFLALVLSSLFVPLWRRLETRGVGVRALAPSAAVLAASIVLLYFSPWNVARNTALAYQKALALEPEAFVPDSAMLRAGRAVTDPAAIWEARDEDLFAARWETSRVVRRPLAANRSADTAFLERSDQLPPYPNRVPPELAGGDDSRQWAGVAGGDLNQDGFPDLAVAKIGSPLRIWINDRRGGFVDATALFFPDEVPEHIEHLALADFNNDTWLDLLVVPSYYFGTTGGTLHLFDPGCRCFGPAVLTLPRRHNSGGITVADLNGDRKLDFYVSFGIDVYSEALDHQYAPDADVFYLSGPDGWQDALTETLAPWLTEQSFAGMTPLFVDFDQDGRLDFLLGNDFTDPSLTFRGTADGRFEILPAALIENNTKDSMSYFAIDFDNDGEFELWENGTSRELTTGRVAYAKAFPGRNRTPLNREIEHIEKLREFGTLDCAGFSDPVGQALCRTEALLQGALNRGDAAACENIANRAFYHSCRWVVRMRTQSSQVPGPGVYKYDVERYPKQLGENVLLRRDRDSGRWRNVLKYQRHAEFTGWTWAAWPMDFDNDGRLDLYISNGFVSRSHDRNRLLRNESRGRRIVLTEVAPDFGLDLEDNGRGVLGVDFDLDGDADLLVNNYLIEPRHFENTLGGPAALVDLRCRTANYYCLGAVMKLRFSRETLTRAVTLGGHWNTSQPSGQHFGFPPGEDRGVLSVRWPDGTEQDLGPVYPGHRFVFYQ